MAFENLVLLAPCHGIEDFPLYHTGDDAASLLACWTSLWHPTLLHHAKRLPRVERCDYPPEDVSSSLFVLPKPCESELSEALPAEIEAAGSLLLRDTSYDRSDLVSAALASYEGETNVAEDLVQDFFAFGFTLLQVELLTQQMRYSSSIEQSRIERIVSEAAQLATDGDVEACREKLVLGHDALADERNHYYPVDVFLIDLTLLVESTVDLSQHALRWGDPSNGTTVPTNIIASGSTMEKLQQQHPQACEQLRQAIMDGRVGIAGGEYVEHPLPLMAPDSVLRQFQRGLGSWQEVVGKPPRTFARRRSGIYPSLVHSLRTAGFQSALHMRFDEGGYPESNQSKLGWLSDAAQETTALPTLGRQPLNANAHHTFLDFPRELSEAMDTDFVAVRAFWHWPGHTVASYEDLRRACRLGTALGKFVTLEDFFDTSAESTAKDDFSPSNYRYPYLLQSCKQGRVSLQCQWMDYWHHALNCQIAEGTLAMSNALGSDCPPARAAIQRYQQAVDDLTMTQDHAADLAAETISLKAALARQLVGEPTAGCKTIINPLPFPRRVLLDGALLPGPGQGSSVYASSGEGSDQRTLVDVPGMGFATLRCDVGPSPELSGPQLADGMSLRNEFLHATIDPVTGALRSLRDHTSRTTRLSQQVALRITVPKTGQHWIDRQTPVAYSVMAADRAEITANGKLFAEITTAGRMLAPNGDVVGEFVQRFQVTRGNRILTVEIEVVPQHELLLDDDPWNSYYASRFAFADESAVLLAGRHLQAVEVTARRFEAPLLVDIDAPAYRTTLFPAGLPFHRRVSASQLDTLLVTGHAAEADPANEDPSSAGSAPIYRIGIGVDVPHPMSAALDWIAQSTPPLVVDGQAPSPAGWLFHVTAKNVIVSSWETDADGCLVLHLVESMGRRTGCRLHALRPWKTLQRVTICGDVLDDLPINDGAGTLSLAPFETVKLKGVLAPVS